MSFCIRDPSIEQSTCTWRVNPGFDFLNSRSFQSLYLKTIIHIKENVYLQRQPWSSSLEVIQNSLTNLFFFLLWKTCYSVTTDDEQKWKTDKLVEKKKDLYYVTIFQQQSLSGKIKHGCGLIQSKMRKWFPMHTLLWLSAFFAIMRPPRFWRASHGRWPTWGDVLWQFRKQKWLQSIKRLANFP